MKFLESMQSESDNGPDGALGPEQIREVIENTKQKIEMNEVGGDSTKADLFRLKLAVSLWSLAVQNRNSSHGEFLTKRAIRWSQRQITQIDYDKLADQFDTAGAQREPAATSEQSHNDVNADEDNQSAEVQRVVSLATKPERSLDELAGKDLHEEFDRIVDQLRTADRLAGRHQLYTNRNLGCILFKGIPGTGKTHAAEGLANRLQSVLDEEVTFLPLTGTNLKSHLYGKSQQIVEGVFEWANEHGPTVVFIDEFDEIASRDKHEETQAVTNTILKSLDGATAYENLILIGATNRADDIDDAMESRFRVDVEFTEPPEEVKPHILHSKLDDDGVEVGFDQAALSTLDFDGLVGRDLATAAEIAITEANRSHRASGPGLPIKVTKEHVETALTTVRSADHDPHSDTRTAGVERVSD